MEWPQVAIGKGVSGTPCQHTTSAIMNKQIAERLTFSLRSMNL